jgi:phospho-N-acetylmuramoyl-pentapeptide-transferase
MIIILTMDPDTLHVVKVLLPTAVAFLIGIAITPFWANFLYKHRMWKKSSVKTTTDGFAATISAKLHNDEERKTPRMGGVIIWASALGTALLFEFVEHIAPGSLIGGLGYISRSQTWLPLFMLIAGALCGLIDDYLVSRDAGSYKGGGLSLTTRLLFVAALGVLGAWWFYSKLEFSGVYLPFLGNLELGALFIPFFVLFMIGIYSGGIIDGVDGLSGGVFAVIFSAYAIIAYAQGQYDLATFSSVIAGATLAFLWFNIPPARFFNSETGTMALTTSLVVVAFLSEQVIVLPIIAFLLIATSASSLIQIASKKFRHGKKVFVVAPLHNHFQAIGWPSYKVTMRYWVLSVVFAIIGVIIALVG